MIVKPAAVSLPPPKIVWSAVTEHDWMFKLAGVVVAEPRLLVKTASYWLPFSARGGREAVGGRGCAGDGAERRRRRWCSLPTARVGAGLPLAAAVKVAVPPAVTVWLAGFAVTVGA